MVVDSGRGRGCPGTGRCRLLLSSRVSVTRTRRLILVDGLRPWLSLNDLRTARPRQADTTQVTRAQGLQFRPIILPGPDIGARLDSPGMLVHRQQPELVLFPTVGQLLPLKRPLIRREPALRRSLPGRQRSGILRPLRRCLPLHHRPRGIARRCRRHPRRVPGGPGRRVPGGPDHGPLRRAEHPRSRRLNGTARRPLGLQPRLRLGASLAQRPKPQRASEAGAGHRRRFAGLDLMRVLLRRQVPHWQARGGQPLPEGKVRGIKLGLHIQRRLLVLLPRCRRLR